MNIGTLTIEMAANVARLQKDMESARRSVEGTMDRIRSAASAAGTALGAIGVGLSTAAFTGFIRNAINAIDQLDEMSQRTGVATEQLAGLQLAFQQSGMDSGAMQSALSKLSKAMVENSDALKSMGLSARNADGSLKDTRQMLGEVADKFTTYKDGAGKAALAMELFGKSGAELLPLLAEGSEGLAKFDAMAQALGLTMSSETAASAGKFNDTVELLGMGLQGIGMQVAAQLLPTLENLTGQFLESMTKGDALRTVSDALATTLKGLYTVGVGIVNIFSAVGKTLGAAGAQLVAVLTGDFKAAAQIGQEWRADMQSSWASTAETLKAVWSDTGNTTVAAFTAMGGAAKKEAPNVKAFGDAAKTAAEEQKKAEKEAHDAAMERRKQWLKDHEDMMKAQEEEDKALQASIDAWADKVEAIDKDAEALRAQADKQEEANKLIGKSKVEVAAFTAAKYRDVAAMKLQAAATADIIDPTKRLGDAYRAAAAEAMRLADAVEAGAAAEAMDDFRKDQEKEFAKTWDQISQGFVDALMQGGKSIKEYLIGLFRTMVLRPILAPVGGLFASIFGGTASAAGAGASGAASSGIGSGIMNAVTGVAGTFGSYLATGFMNTIAGTGTAASWAAGQGLIAAGQTSAGAGMMAGAALPWVAGGLLVANALGLFRKTKQVGGGLTGTLGEGDINQYALMRKSGTLFGGPSYSLNDQGVADISADIQRAFDDIRQNAANMADALGLSRDAALSFTTTLGKDVLHPDTGGIGLKLDGMTPEQQSQAIADALSGANEELAQFLLGTEDYTREGEKASQTLERLATSITVTNDTFEYLGWNLYDVSLAGADAASSFLDLVGGVDNFNTLTSKYLQDYYTETERTAMATDQLTKQFGDLGLTLPASRAELRALIEGARAAGDDTLLANLLKLAPAFSQISESADAAAQSAAATAQAEAYAKAEVEASRQRAAEAYWKVEEARIQAAAKAAEDARKAAEKAAQDEARAVQDAARQRLNSIVQMMDVIESTIANIYGTTASTAGMNAQQGRSIIQAALASGVLPSSDDLNAAIQAVQAGFEATQYSTRFQMERDRLVFAGELSDLMRLGTTQSNIEQAIIDAAQQRLDGGASAAAAQDPAWVQQARATAYTPPTEVSSGMANAALSNPATMGDELRALRAEVVNLRAEAQAIAVNTGKTKRILERVSRDGDSIQVVTV